MGHDSNLSCFVLSEHFSQLVHRWQGDLISIYFRPYSNIATKISNSKNMYLKIETYIVLLINYFLEKL